MYICRVVRDMPVHLSVTVDYSRYVTMDRSRDVTAGKLVQPMHRAIVTNSSITDDC